MEIKEPLIPSLNFPVKTSLVRSRYDFIRAAEENFVWDYSQTLVSVTYLNGGCDGPREHTGIAQSPAALRNTD